MKRYGIYQVTIPLPFWNDNVHCYLAQRKGKWTIIDTAMNNEETRARWNAAFSEHGIDPKKDIERTLITHHHPDHFEYASELQKQSGADVFMSKQEQSLALNILDEKSFSEFYLESGMPEELVKQLRPVNKSANRFPGKIRTIEENELFAIGELVFEALHMPGHSDGHICFYNKDEKILLSGDHLSKGITPYIAYHGIGDKNPLAAYLSTLKKMQTMEINLVLPGHGPVFSDAEEQITELLHHFENRIDFVLKKMTKEMTGYEISQTLFTDRNSVLEQWIRIGETNAFLQYMVSKGEVRVEKVGKQYKYKRV